MDKEYIKLDNDGTYVLMAPDQLLFLYEATEEEAKKELEKIKQTENSKIDSVNSCANIAFITTFDCNLNCVYCYAKGGDTKEYISLDNAVKALNYVKQKTSLNELNLYFVGGGEPLLDLNLVENIVAYSENLFRHVFIHVVTNGTFNRKTLDWIINKKVHTRISFDGVG